MCVALHLHALRHQHPRCFRCFNYLSTISCTIIIYFLVLMFCTGMVSLYNITFFCIALIVLYSSTAACALSDALCYWIQCLCCN